MLAIEVLKNAIFLKKNIPKSEINETFKSLLKLKIKYPINFQNFIANFLKHIHYSNLKIIKMS